MGDDAAELALLGEVGWKGDPAIEGMNEAEMFRRGAAQLLEDSRYAGYWEATFSGLAAETSITAVFGNCDTESGPQLEHVVIDTMAALDPESPACFVANRLPTCP